LTGPILLRLCADAVLLQAALIAALVLRYTTVMLFQNPRDPQELLRLYLRFYAFGAIPITALCLGFFLLTGFYHRGRTYQSRYKIAVVIQGTTFAFLAFGFLAYMFGEDSFGFTRIALVIAWILSNVLLIAARLWNHFWQRIAIGPGELSEARGPGSAQVEQPGTVLVIGGAGYIGSALIPQLLTNGHRTRVLDMMLFGRSPLAAWQDHPLLEIVEGDFRHVNNVVRALQGVETVVHLGAIVGDPACNLDENLTIDINLSATRMIAEFARTHGVRRFLFASTCSVYGASPDTLDERSETRPVGIYGDTKLASEKVLLELSSPGFAVTVLRFATIFGLSGRTRFDLVVNLLTAKARVDGEITVFSGQQWRPFVHVEDAARSILMAIEAPSSTVAGQIFNVGSNELNYRISEVGEMIHRQVPDAKLSVSEDIQDRRNYRVDFSKIRDTLGFQPAWTVEQGVAQVLAAIDSGQVLDYRDAQYSNVKLLSVEGTAQLERDRWARELIRDIQTN
jgi:nucleoside-diphosphate-sugar epimerase